MDRKSFLPLVLVLPVLGATLTGCANNNTGMDQALFNSLNRGFKATGVLNLTTKFYEDEEHIVPSSKVETINNKLQLTLTYTNTDTFIGMDYKLYSILKDDSLEYVGGENVFNNDGYLGFYQVGYNNEVEINNEFEQIAPYGTNTSLNPFSLVKPYDFTSNGDIYTLNQVKSDLVFGDLMYNLMFIPLNLSTEKLDFVIKDNVLTNIKTKTKSFFGISTVNLVNYYTESNYEIDFSITEIGKSKSWEEVKPEPIKKENDILRVAFDNLDKASSYRVSRHFTTPLDPSEETVDVYFSGKEEAVYMQVYDSHISSRPTVAGPADALLYDSSKDSDRFLNAYMLQASSKDETKQVFKKAADLAPIDNVFHYSQFLLPKLSILSVDVFNKNDDGSYSPIPEHLAYMASDLFVPFLNATNEIAGGYVDSFKLYLTEDKLNIDRIELDTSIGEIVGHVTIKYDQINS